MNVIEPRLLNTINETANHIGGSRTGVYKLLDKGKLVAVKEGRNRLITGKSIVQYVDNLVNEQVR